MNTNFPFVVSAYHVYQSSHVYQSRSLLEQQIKLELMDVYFLYLNALIPKTGAEMAKPLLTKITPEQKATSFPWLSKDGLNSWIGFVSWATLTRGGVLPY